MTENRSLHADSQSTKPFENLQAMWSSIATVNINSHRTTETIHVFHTDESRYNDAKKATRWHVHRSLSGLNSWFLVQVLLGIAISRYNHTSWNIVLSRLVCTFRRRPALCDKPPSAVTCHSTSSHSTFSIRLLDKV